MSSSFGPDVVSAPQTEETPKTAAEFILTVLKLQIPICNLENLEIASGNPLGTGVTAEVRQGSWKGAAVAVKTLKLQLPDLGDSPDEVEQIREKHDAMLEEITREVCAFSPTHGFSSTQISFLFLQLLGMLKRNWRASMCCSRLLLWSYKIAH
jgi:hypothetical protein